MFISQILCKAQEAANKIEESKTIANKDIISLDIASVVVYSLSLIAIAFGLIQILRKPKGQRLQFAKMRENQINILIAAGIFLVVFQLSGFIFATTIKILKPNIVSKSDHYLYSALVRLFANIPSILAMLFLSKLLFKKGLAGIGFPKLVDYPKDIAKGIYYFIAAYLPVSIGMMFVALVLMVINNLTGSNYGMGVHSTITQLKQMPLGPQIILLFAIGVLVPIFEELIFRGYIQTSFRNYLGPVASIALASIPFTAMHANITHFPALFILSSFMGYSYEKTGKILVPITIHVCFNSSVIIMGIIQTT